MHLEGDGKSRGVGHEPSNAHLLDPPSELTIEDMHELSKILPTPSPNPGSTPNFPKTTDARECGEQTTHIHEIFDCIEKQIIELSKELDLVTDIVSFEAIKSKYSALQKGFTNQK